MAKELKITASDAVEKSTKSAALIDIDSVERAVAQQQSKVDTLDADLKAAKASLAAAKAALKDSKDAYDSAWPAPPATKEGGER